MAATMDDFFSAPDFKADEALMTLKRLLRSLGLVERSHRFEWKTQRILEWTLADERLDVRLAKRPLASPDFDRISIQSSAQLRQLTEDVKRRLARWSDE